MAGKFRNEFGDEVEAIQFAGNFEEIEQFCGGDAELRNSKLLVATRRGPLWASTDEWIVKLEETVFVVCTHDEFRDRYAPVS